jgi:hypothetical protein
MFGFFPSDALVGFCHFGITFAVGLTTHRQIHSNFVAFSGKMCLQTFQHFGINALSNTKSVLVGPL